MKFISYFLAIIIALQQYDTIDHQYYANKSNFYQKKCFFLGLPETLLNFFENIHIILSIYRYDNEPTILFG